MSDLMNALAACAWSSNALKLPPDPLSLEWSAPLLEVWKPAQPTSRKIAI
jgi:hypothetical protein